MGNRAADYRGKLRAAEAERDTLRATLTTLQRQRVEQEAQAHGITADALWTVADLDGLLDADGDPDGEAIAGAAAAAQEKLGITPKPVGIAGLESGAMRRPPPTDRFTDAFKAKE